MIDSLYGHHPKERLVINIYCAYGLENAREQDHRSWVLERSPELMMTRIARFFFFWEQKINEIEGGMKADR